MAKQKAVITYRQKILVVKIADGDFILNGFTTKGGYGAVMEHVNL